MNPFEFLKRGRPFGVDSPNLLAFQPRPLLVRVVHFRMLGGWMTAIMRHWGPGDSGKQGRCKLCPECRAYDDGCLTVVGGLVAKSEASLYSIHGFKLQESSNRSRKP